MFHFGVWEILLVLLVVLLIFGPKKLPSLGKGLAQFFKNLKGEVKGVQKDAKDIEKHIT
ncbi:MAG: twin-arginine translocase TatA/TatE family subunit [bacterium]|nr:twin-arginine translocase TatA/TatE family subunit [bacterium]